MLKDFFHKKKQLLVVIKTGKSDSGLNASLGYTFALSALAFKSEVTIFFTGDGAIWATEDWESEDTWGFPPIAQMSNDFRSEGGKELVCMVCYKSCVVAKTPLRKEVKTSGIASVVPYVLNGSALVF